MKPWLALFIIMFSPLPSLAIEYQDSKSTPIVVPIALSEIYYFDKDWKSIKAPTSKGFYRKLLKITGSGFLVQDFYQNSNKKQSNPILLKYHTDLTKGEPKSIDGPLVLWYENGQKSMEVLYKNGKKQGLLTSWHINGNKEVEQNYMDNKENGLATYWNKQGEKNLTFNYKDGSLDTVTAWKNNKKVSEKHYKNNKKEGLTTYWYENGNIRATETYHNDTLDGSSHSYFTNGQKQSSFNYKNNEPQQITLWYKNTQKAAELDTHTTTQSPITCSIWDEKGQSVYTGNNTERCLLTIRNITDDENTQTP